jgi:polar amino acid transport system permease protein
MARTKGEAARDIRGGACLMDEMLSRFQEYMPQVLPAAGLTIALTFGSMLLASVLGALAAIWRYVPLLPLRFIARFYVDTTRNVPELVQIYIWFFVLPEVGIVLPPLIAGLCALGFAFGAYLAEVFRGGIEAVSPTQWDSARVLAMRPALIWRRIVLPQAARNILPVWTSYFVSMYKATAYLSIAAVPELMTVIHHIASVNFRFFELFALAAVIYVVMGIPTIWGLRRLEHHWSLALRPGSGLSHVL